MNEGRKRAYRHLLYWAMLDIRTLCQWAGKETYDPRKVWKQYQRSRRAGALANLLHNAASSSQTHFQNFDENRFWENYERFIVRFPNHRTDYKQLFEDELERWEEKKR